MTNAGSTQPSKKYRKLLLWLTAVAIVAAAALLLPHTRVGEGVKRETARLLDYEYIPDQHFDLAGREAASAADSLYKDFRRNFRFHYQTIGLASFADSSRMILLSDLPPHFETDSIPSIFAKFNHNAELRRHRIGYDGYVSDLLILLANATRENCDNLIKRLSKELYFSEYKPAVTLLPVENKRQYYARENIDYQITLDEFNTWFMVDGEGFFRLDDTSRVLTVSDLFAAQARGVFFSRTPGFVAWALAKNSDIMPQRGDIRQFTLDADLILGALADSSTLVVIGRERQSPLCELPPLQIESILLLASTTEKELSQSLDVNDFMAGKMKNGRDWCPTYLSRELENTEFGDLMTITDVLLKDWSEHGTIREGFYRYPEPGYYPFDKPLFRKLGLDELVYNWNTADAMYAIDCDGYTLYTLNRTGSLPVSYFNSQERSQSIGYRYENQAYHYFATLGNTDLARVVQYTALYQLFIDNGVSYSGNTYPSFPKNKPFLLSKPAANLLDTLRRLDDTHLASLADSLAQRLFDDFQKADVDKQLGENEQAYNFSYTDGQVDQIYRNVLQGYRTDIVGNFREVRQMLRALPEEQFTALARYLSYPRGVRIHDRESYNTMLRGRQVNMLMRRIGKNNLDLLGTDLNDIKNFFSNHLSANAGRYMKTSSLIVTFNDMRTTGGHNLSSRISRVKSMKNYKRQRGNFTPEDYPRPSEPAPTVTDDSPASSSPKSDSPSSATPKNNRPPSANPTAKTQSTKSTAKSTAPAKRSPQGSNVRPRSSVISSAPRSKRGF